MENITAEFVCFKTHQNTSHHVWLVLGNSDNLELKQGNNTYIAQLYLVELFVEILKILGYKNHRNETWAVCEFSDCSTD
jgi:hypothetical protein